MKRARIDLRVRVDEKELFESEAKKRGLTISELIRRAVGDFLEGNPIRSSRKARTP